MSAKRFNHYAKNICQMFLDNFTLPTLSSNLKVGDSPYEDFYDYLLEVKNSEIVLDILANESKINNQNISNWKLLENIHTWFLTDLKSHNLSKESVLSANAVCVVKVNSEGSLAGYNNFILNITAKILTGKQEYTATKKVTFQLKWDYSHFLF